MISPYRKEKSKPSGNVGANDDECDPTANKHFGTTVKNIFYICV